MKIQSKYLNEVEIKESKIISFDSGIPGFIDETKFVLLDLPGTAAFQAMQSIQTPELAFIVTNPHHFHEEYELKLDKQLIESLGIENKQDVVILTIVTLKTPFESSTINLKAPIVINSTSKKGKQYILNTTNHSARAPIAPPTTSEVKGD